ncbi:hypothetical protein HJA83_07330 [Rhizobium bangladeshense]|nr:hypothetical protein [Rhizobium bangladeshense]MBX4915238.1 hypothetical protein [Rhizobium bangladeshense]
MTTFGRKLMPPAELICLQGVIDAPPWLAMEMANLIRFKTATLTALGFQRNGVWAKRRPPRRSNISA